MFQFTFVRRAPPVLPLAGCEASHVLAQCSLGLACDAAECSRNSTVDVRISPVRGVSDGGRAEHDDRHGGQLSQGGDHPFLAGEESVDGGSVNPLQLHALLAALRQLLPFLTDRRGGCRGARPGIPLRRWRVGRRRG